MAFILFIFTLSVHFFLYDVHAFVDFSTKNELVWRLLQHTFVAANHTHMKEINDTNSTLSHGDDREVREHFHMDVRRSTWFYGWVALFSFLIINLIILSCRFRVGRQRSVNRFDRHSMDNVQSNESIIASLPRTPELLTMKQINSPVFAPDPIFDM
mmetsp:Transcript_3243/g.5817  ORF Transcript_3243/g.5817 Transcript_3243/m.5817 type:complete len:156 (-) Transcript_3243:171-638(-)